MGEVSVTEKIRMPNELIATCRFCLHTKRDPESTLKQCQASTFKGYLLWSGKNSKIKKESSIMTYWRNLSMLYCDKAKTWMDHAVLYDIGNASSPLQSRRVARKLTDLLSGFLLPSRLY